MLGGAEVAKTEGYHECDWNVVVHAPLFSTIFSTQPPADTMVAGKTAQTRMMCALSAKIQSEYLPTISQPNRIHDPDFDAETASTTTERIKNSGHKKVDFVLSMEAVRGTALRDVLMGIVRGQDAGGINQTRHTPLQYDPVAVSIETKEPAASQDTSLQLGTWIEAWHKRMLAHRDYLQAEFPEIMGQVAGMRVPSSMLIEVVGHRWTLYYACDGGSRIDLYGPVDIGATYSLTEIYGLVAALTTIKDWVEGDFREQMEKWFVCDKLARVFAGEARPTVETAA